MQLDERVAAVLAQMDDRRSREGELARSLSREEFYKRIDEFMLAVGPEAGRFMYLLALAAGARNILELGTSVGYSTLWLAAAASHNGGRVTTLDSSPRKHEQARNYLADAGLDSQVTCITADGQEFLQSTEESFDFVLIDIWKNLYVPCYEALLPHLSPGGIILADNMTFPESAHAEAEAYRKRVRETPGMESVLVPIGNGIEFSRHQS